MSVSYCGQSRGQCTNYNCPCNSTSYYSNPEYPLNNCISKTASFYPLGFWGYGTLNGGLYPTTNSAIVISQDSVLTCTFDAIALQYWIFPIGFEALTVGSRQVPVNASVDALLPCTPTAPLPPGNTALMSFTESIDDYGYQIFTGTKTGTSIGVAGTTTMTTLISARIQNNSAQGTVVMYNDIWGANIPPLSGTYLSSFTNTPSANQITLTGTWADDETVVITYFACGNPSGYIPNASDGLTVTTYT